MDSVAIQTQALRKMLTMMCGIPTKSTFMLSERTPGHGAGYTMSLWGSVAIQTQALREMLTMMCKNRLHVV